MECACTVPIEIDDVCLLHFISIPTALTNSHVCGECNRRIPKGEEYIIECTEYDHEITVYTTCEDCYSIRQVFFSSGWYYGEIRDQFEEFIVEYGGDVSVSCILQLTKRARDWVLDKIEEYWKEQEEYN